MNSSSLSRANCCRTLINSVILRRCEQIEVRERSAPLLTCLMLLFPAQGSATHGTYSIPNQFADEIGLLLHTEKLQQNLEHTVVL